MRTSRRLARAVLIGVLAVTSLTAGSSARIRELRAAVMENDIAAATAALDAGADPNAANRHEEHLLHLALQTRRERLAQLLLSRGADPNLTDLAGRPALHLLSPLTILAQSEFGGLISDVIMWKLARYVCTRELSAETVDLVIAKSAEIDVRDSRGATALMDAAACGHARTFNQLVKAGASTRTVTNDGGSVLAFAAVGGAPQVVRQLLTAGADPNMGGPDGGGALHSLASRSSPAHLEVLQMLLEGGAAIDKPDRNGRTPLMRAAENKQGEPMVAALLAAGADATLKDGQEKTAADLAVGARNIELLRQASSSNAGLRSERSGTAGSRR